MKKRNYLGMVAVAALFVLSGCGSSGSSEKKVDGGGDAASTEQVFNLTVAQEMPSADLSVATDTISFAALNNVYEGLYRLNDKDEVEPAGAAELAEVSDDGLVYKLKLNEDAKWSNGDPVTAKDYVYGWQRTTDPKTASEYSYLYACVKNGAAVAAGEKPVTDLGIKAISDYELEITLEVTTPYFDYLLAFPSFFPQNQKVVEEFGDKYASNSENAVYNGPFTLEEFDGPGSDTNWVYQKNKDYWDADTVKLETINVDVVKEASTGLNLFEAGKADDVTVSGEIAAQMKDNPAYFPAEEARTSYIEMNQKGDNAKLWTNVNMRQAFSAAIDRQGLVENVLGDGSIASTGIIPKGTSKNPDTGEDFAEEAGDQNPFDAAKAKELWEKAKSELGIDSAEINMIGSDDDATKKVMEKIQADVEENLPGVKVTITPVPFSVRLERSNSGDFDIVMGGWGADYLDASSFTDLFVTGVSYNRGHYSSKKYDELVKLSNTTDAADKMKRWEDLQNAAKVLVEEDMGVIPVFQKVEGHLINQDFKGIVHHAAGASWDYKWAYKE
jgi:oligopeptide transport system substrate-binding protein